MEALLHMNGRQLEKVVFFFEVLRKVLDGSFLKKIFFLYYFYSFLFSYKIK